MPCVGDGPLSYWPRGVAVWQVGLIIALRGALFGSLLCYVMPAFIYLRSARGRAASTAARALHRLLAGYGLAMAALGTACVLVFK